MKSIRENDLKICFAVHYRPYIRKETLLVITVCEREYIISMRVISWL